MLAQQYRARFLSRLENPYACAAATESLLALVAFAPGDDALIHAASDMVARFSAVGACGLHDRLCAPDHLWYLEGEDRAMESLDYDGEAYHRRVMALHSHSDFRVHATMALLDAQEASLRTVAQQYQRWQGGGDIRFPYHLNQLYLPVMQMPLALAAYLGRDAAVETLLQHPRMRTDVDLVYALCVSTPEQTARILRHTDGAARTAAKILLRRELLCSGVSVPPRHGARRRDCDTGGVVVNSAVRIVSTAACWSDVDGYEARLCVRHCRDRHALAAYLAVLALPTDSALLTECMNCALAAKNEAAAGAVYDHCTRDAARIVIRDSMKLLLDDAVLTGELAANHAGFAEELCHALSRAHGGVPPWNPGAVLALACTSAIHCRDHRVLWALCARWPEAWPVMRSVHTSWFMTQACFSDGSGVFGRVDEGEQPYVRVSSVTARERALLLAARGGRTSALLLAQHTGFREALRATRPGIAVGGYEMYDSIAGLDDGERQGLVVRCRSLQVDQDVVLRALATVTTQQDACRVMRRRRPHGDAVHCGDIVRLHQHILDDEVTAEDFQHDDERRVSAFKQSLRTGAAPVHGVAIDVAAHLYLGRAETATPWYDEWALLLGSLCETRDVHYGCGCHRLSCSAKLFAPLGTAISRAELAFLHIKRGRLGEAAQHVFGLERVLRVYGNQSYKALRGYRDALPPELVSMIVDYAVMAMVRDALHCNCE